MKTVEFHVRGQAATLSIARKLIERSAWFAVEPQPDDWYCFSIKPGEGLERIFD